MDAAERCIPVLVGPTAVGKSAVIAAVADAVPIAVVSADSRQVYRRLDIGTAKPDPDTLRRVPHCGIGVVEVGESYSAGQFARDVARWLSALTSERRAVVVGGTGFYIRALTEGLFEEPRMSTERRDRLRRWTTECSDLERWATRLDPAFPGGSRRRAARAVEVALLTGRPLSQWQLSGSKPVIPRARIVHLTVPRTVLHDRIRERVASMLAAGWIGEVEDLLGAGVPPGAAGLDAVGYREIVEMLVGQLRRSDLEETIVRNTRRYAKRQETWFRHQLGGTVTTLDGTSTPSVLAQQFVEIWKTDVTQCASA